MGGKIFTLNLKGVNEANIFFGIKRKEVCLKVIVDKTGYVVVTRKDIRVS